MFSGFRGRFGRRRHPDERVRAIDESWLRKLAAALPVESLTRVACEGVPESFALLATGRDAGGREWLAAVSPRSGLDATLAVALAAQRGLGGADATRVAASPEWTSTGRRLCAELAVGGRGLRAVEIEGDGEERSADESVHFLPPERMGAALPSAEARELFGRAAEGLRGLAAKHGGVLRSAGGELELVIAASAIAALRAEGSEPTLEIRFPSRASHGLQGGQLAEVLDRLEGQVRKRLNDRESRDGEEGLRARLVRALAPSVAPRLAVLWPCGGAAEAADGVGVAEDGSLVVFAARDRLGLPELGAALGAAAALDPVLPWLTRDAAPPVRLFDRAQLVLAGRHVDPAVEALAPLLPAAPRLLRALHHEGPFLPVGPERSTPAPQPAPAARSFDPVPQVPQATAVPAPFAASDEPLAEASGSGNLEGGRRRRRRRRRGGRGGRPFEEGRFASESEGAPGAEEEFAEDENGAGEEASEAGPPARFEDDAARPSASEVEPASGGGFEEMSLLDFDEEAPRSEPPAGQPHRGRRRRRGRRGRGAERNGGDEGDDEEEPARAERSEPEPEEEVDVLEVPDLAEVPEVTEPVVPRYDDEEEEPESELDRIRHERERRRRERAQEGAAVTASAEPGRAETAERGLPRGRAAIVAHADRESITAAVLLARELRQLEGIWIYPQEELMTFFRGVATDLRDNTPIYMLGFQAKPARDVLQAATLYQGRLVWFDHHDWPPEDLGALRSALSAEYTLVQPGGDSVLPLVLPHCGRRSRFSDKLVDLVTGRFTAHDFQRWGRLWWWRLGQLAQRPGERRAELDLLIAGRPSDLSREAERCDVPPPPPELAWVAGRDFRIVHFAGIAMVIAEVPAPLDLHMALRIARERFGALLALGRAAEGDVFVLTADDVGGRRPIDVAAMVEHLTAKFEWVMALPEDDHVARFRVRGLAGDPQRAETVVAEIGMGRSILEG
jgi:hypothetical protein